MPTYSTTSATLTKACLLLLAGGFAAQHSRLPIDSDHCSALFVAAVVFFLFRRMRGCAVFICGFALFIQAGNSLLDARLLPRFAGDSLLTTVRLVDFPRVSDRSVSMLVEAVDDPRIPARTRISWYDPPVVPAIGDVWQFELRLKRPRGSSNPGAPNHENWLFREKIMATGYVVPGKRNRLLARGDLSPVQRYRRDFVAHATADGRDAGPLLAAIGVGARHLISAEQWERFRATGTSHLVAISGLHIGLAAAAAYALVALLSGAGRLRGNHLDRALVVSGLIAAAYALISGFAVPAERASLMLGLAGVAMFCRRPAAPGRIVALSALSIYVLDPLALMAPGFVLSFAAVVLLLWLARAHTGSGFSHRIADVARLQFALLLGLMPLTVLAFGYIALVAPAINMLAVPVFSLLTVPLTLASMLMQPLWSFAADVFLYGSALSLRSIEWLVSWFAAIPLGHSVVAGAGGPATLLLCLVFIPAVWVLLPQGWPGRWLGILGVLGLLVYAPRPPGEGCFDADFLDVGQGLAVVVRSRNHTLVYDAGRSFPNGGSMAQRVLLPFLEHRGIRSIDTLVISHADDDHAGGAATLVRNLPVGRSIAGEALPGLAARPLPCWSAANWGSDGVEFRFLHPAISDAFEGNDSSCVLLVSAGDFHLLLTGDIESRAEAAVIRRIEFAKAAVVLIPHHGSLTSSSPAFVHRLRPEYAVASASFGNHWGLPKERVLRRWEASGAEVLTTAHSGAIGFRMCAASGIRFVREERQRRRRFWYD